VRRSSPGAAAPVEAADAAVAARLRTLRPTRALVSLDALAANYSYLRERAAGADVLAIVKADAYGHGAVPCARRLEAEGARWFGVAIVEEGLELREAGIRGRILLLGGADGDALRLAVRHDLTPAVVSRESLDALLAHAAESGRPLACHVKVDTGMTRLGLPWTDFLERAPRLAAEPRLRVEGLFTHLACSDDPAVPFTRVQLERFRQCSVAWEQARGARPLLHVASSAGLLTRAETDVELVRPGGALYGLNPFGNQRAPELTPVLTLVSRVVRVVEVPAGTAVGYGSTFITLRASRLATIPLGYDDGLPRQVSDDWEVAVGGGRAPLVGRVSMDLVVADVTDLDGVGVGSEVVVAGGGDGSPALPIEEMAHRLRTIAYEVTSGISSRVPRLFVEGGVVTGIASRFEHLRSVAADAGSA
jgi:alanine racemase